MLVISMAKLAKPVTKGYVRDMARTMLEPGASEPFGVRWVDVFLLRHPALALHSAVRRDEKRIDPSNLATVKSWYERSEKTVTEFSIKHENIYTMDETEFQHGDSK